MGTDSLSSCRADDNHVGRTLPTIPQGTEVQMHCPLDWSHAGKMADLMVKWCLVTCQILPEIWNQGRVWHLKVARECKDAGRRPSNNKPYGFGPVFGYSETRSWSLKVQSPCTIPISHEQSNQSNNYIINKLYARDLLKYQWKGSRDHITKLRIDPSLSEPIIEIQCNIIQRGAGHHNDYIIQCIIIQRGCLWIIIQRGCLYIQASKITNL